MKKHFIPVCVAVVAAAFAACSSEVEPAPAASGEATIVLNVSNDNEMKVATTRASVTNSDLSQWTAKVTKNSEAEQTTTADQLSGMTFKENDAVTITVSNYKDLATAMPEKAAGNAYYEGTTSEKKTLKAGANPITISCGKAKNCRVKATWTNTELIKIKDIETKQPTDGTARSYTFTEPNTVAYYYASQNIEYTIHYTFNNNEVTKNLTGKSIANPEAAKEYVLNVVSNSNGSITINIEYDDAFDKGEGTSITIDAVTGEEAKNQNN